MKSFALLASLILIGCGGDDVAVIDAPQDGDITDVAVDVDAAVDAPGPDAPPSTVMVVTCPIVVASSVSTPGFNFQITDPTITTGDVVRFQIDSFHTATSGTVTGGVATPDGRFNVPFGGQPVCLQFTAPGDFPFYCEPHLFTGLLTVSDPV